MSIIEGGEGEHERVCGQHSHAGIRPASFFGLANSGSVNLMMNSVSLSLYKDISAAILSKD